MKVLFVGDIVGNPGREVFARLVPAMKASREVDFVIANAENAAGGSGITEKIAREIFLSGCDVMTLGDHVWDRRELYPYLDQEERILRPANCAPMAPGHGSCLVEAPGGILLGVVMLLGRTFIKYSSDCPFRVLDTILAEMRQKTPHIIVDFHAEATSEKVAMGWHADGRVSAVLGTHTHIQTADERVLPGGTAYLTDAGMTGPYDSVIGQKKELILDRYTTGLPCRFEIASAPGTLCGAIVDLDEGTGKARSIQRVQRA
ncbi:MAG: TIGR00282 family metallophosphoesterase [Elusimicrobia bacterium]|nr:TIGR00282 family metallophosphoesterase [Elusimicrobiota bacterium]